MATWNLDPTHTSLQFAARHMMVTTVRGHFDGATGTLEFDPANPANASVEVTIDAKTLTTGVGDRDNHLRSGDFLDVARFPTITFRSTRVEAANGVKARVHGDLTIRGVTRPVILDVEFLGEQKDPWGGTRVGFEAATKINREDWGLVWNVALESGGVLVGKEIKLEISAQAVLVNEPVTAAVVS